MSPRLRGRYPLLLCTALLLCGCGDEVASGPTPTADEQAFLESLAPAELPPPPPDVSNAWADDPAAAALGERFFFDPLFSGRLLSGDNRGRPSELGVQGETGRVACAGCHIPSAAFADDRSPSQQISLASGWTRRRTPSLLDVGQARLLMWDGSHDALYNQIFGPLESPDEMNTSRLFVAQQVVARYAEDYEAVFGPVPDLSATPALTPETTGCARDARDQITECHGMPGDGAEYDGLSEAEQAAVTRVVVNVGKALGAYERTLTCGPGRFDAWVHGDPDALSESEQRGALLFVGRGQCVSCHAGPYLSDQRFHNVGLEPQRVAAAFFDLDDDGAAEGLPLALDSPLNVRGEFSDGDDGRLPDELDESLRGSFRTPTLRCVAQQPSFMHTGQMRDLEDVVAFFARGGDSSPLLPGTSELALLDLSAEDQVDLVAFLRALDGARPAAEPLAPPE